MPGGNVYEKEIYNYYFKYFININNLSICFYGR